MSPLVPLVTAALRDRPEDLVAAWVFGSIARGEDSATSDVDVGVLYRTALARTLEAIPLALHDALESALRRRVDLVVLDHASPDLVHRVLRDGVLVLERDRSARIAFEVRRRSEYFDMLPTWRRYRRAQRPGA
ncbi:MAG: hypothetical protein NVS3B10_25270 [Polyangiales bacterium]